MMAGKYEGNEKIVPTTQEKDAAGKNIGVPVKCRKGGTDAGAIFLQILKKVVTGGTGRRLLSWHGKAEGSSENGGTDEAASIDMIKRHGVHRKGVLPEEGSERENGNGLHCRTKGAVAALSPLMNHEAGGSGITGSDSGKGGQTVFDMEGPVKGLGKDKQRRMNEDKALSYLNGTSNGTDDRTKFSPATTKGGDEKGTAFISKRTHSVAGGAGRATADKENTGTPADNLSDKSGGTVTGKLLDHADGKSRHVRPGTSGDMNDFGTAAKESAEDLAVDIMKNVAVAGKQADANLKKSHHRKSGESAMNEKITDQGAGLRSQGTGDPSAKMKQYARAHGKNEQWSDGMGGADRGDEIIDGERPVKDFSHEGRLSERISEGKHFPSARIEVQSAVTAKSHEPLNVKPGDVVNQVTAAVQTKLGKGFGRVKIALNPPHLGSVDLDVLVRDNKVHVILKAEHHDVRQILQSNAEILKTGLSSQGLVAETIDVSLHDRMGGNSFQFDHDGRLFDQRQETSRDGGKRGDDEASPDEIIAAEQTVSPSLWKNGQISLFA